MSSQKRLWLVSAVLSVCVLATSGAAGGILYASGSNGNSQLGDGTSDDRYSWAPVSGIGPGVTVVAAGPKSSFAILNGALYGWGYNEVGILGDGTTNEQSTPKLIPGMESGVTAVSTSTAPLHTLAIKNGAAYAWGSGHEGELGNGEHGKNVSSLTPVAVKGLESGVTAVVAAFAHSMAIQNGALYVWGRNQAGELGIETPGTYAQDTPALVPGFERGVTYIAAGNFVSFAVQDGALYAWGDGRTLVMGDGTKEVAYTPRPVTGMDHDVTAVATSNHTTLAVMAGYVYGWGDGSSGQLGTWDVGESLVPLLIGEDILVNIESVAVVGEACFALGTDGKLWAWGYLADLFEDMGYDPYTTPQLVGEGYTAISSGGNHLLAVQKSVPEPATLTLLAAGVTALIARRRRR